MNALRSTPRTRQRLALLMLTTALAAVTAACGGGNDSTTPAPAPVSPDVAVLGAELAVPAEAAAESAADALAALGDLAPPEAAVGTASAFPAELLPPT